MRGLDPLKVKLAVVGDINRKESIVFATTPELKKMGIFKATRLYEIPKDSNIIIVGSGAKILLNLDILILLLYKRCVISMEKENLFKWKNYQPELILLTVRWYLRYNLSFRNLVEMMEERELSIAHTTIMRWIHQYGPQLEKKVRHHLKPTNDSWRVDETYIKIKGQWMYLYHAVDTEGDTIDFYLSQSSAFLRKPWLFRTFLNFA